MSRNTHARAILGADHARLDSTKVLLVGAGGIGCELLKNVVLTGFKNITLLDLDTIDLSNLNRQFLFRKKDVKQSKALVAAKTAAAFNPDVHITPLHANIKEPQFDVAWFGGFDIVLNALDNLDARRHVNKMCMAANVPLVESGTAGYFGQVQPLLKDRTECFDCIPKPTPKTFPVCTIRSTPSQPIHCIVWAKSYLVPQLFGEDEDEGELDDAERQGENAEEIANLRKQAQAFRAVRQALRSTNDDPEAAAKAAFEKVYDADIQNLLIMKDMWRSRAPPVPLDFDTIQSGSFVLRGTPAAPQTNGTSNGTNGAATNGHSHAPGLKDQKTLTLGDNLRLFVSSAVRLAERLRAGEGTISFDKDDDDTLDFVTASSNLRSAAYGIPGKTRWEVKEMAGNIIPAIATTNAVVSGLIVLQALHLLRQAPNAIRNVHLSASKAAIPLSSSSVIPPDPGCAVCRDCYTVVRCDPTRATLGDVVHGVMGGAGREVSVFEGQRVLSDPDWDDNFERTLDSLGIVQGKFVTIVDEDDELATIAVAICLLPYNHPADGPALVLPDPLPQPGKKSKPRAVPPPSPTPLDIVPNTPAKKRRRDEVDDMPEPSAKRARVANGSPSKAQRLEEDGLIIVDAMDVVDVDADAHGDAAATTGPEVIELD
ncbi:hypothetical protein EXIGLDRAFT_611663 [Exidia glandulosa HHB12029]|uniref:Ubiquitin-activating enzyme E1-like n=1 Tax=Exidia glandulosa HHB12029 TaxID=1314781 RepID=A0A165J7G9_EXIGL|nr:hypothetical protein EXIGLDRAFT_611663 [Exidia glandulosa HHB12029]